LYENEEAAIQHVAQNVFALSPEDTQALQVDAVQALPNILAKGFVKSQQNMLEQMGRLVPQMIHRHIQAVTSNARHEQSFFGRWKGFLNPTDHGDTMRRLAVQYRQNHPNVTTTQMIEDLGPLVMMVARVNPSQVVAQQQNGGGARPGVAVNGAGRPPQPSPFAPAVGGGSVASSEHAELTPWEAQFQHQD